MMTYKREYEKIGRNEICPCAANIGVGKKYKHCCLPKVQEIERKIVELERKKSAIHSSFLKR